MAGSPDNDDPRAYVKQDVEKVASIVAGILTEIRPDIVLTYGPDGIYGHPDHIMAHRVGTRAVMRAADEGWQTPHLYYSAAAKGRIKWMAELPDGPFAKMSAGELAGLGIPASEITTWMDVRAYYPRKLAALRAHRTQVGDYGPFASVTAEQRETIFSIESMRTVPLPWNPVPVDVLAGLLPEPPMDHPFRQ